MKKQKILIVVPSEVYGGGEVYIKNLLGSRDFSSKFDIILCSACEQLNSELSELTPILIKGSRSLSFSTFYNIYKVNSLIERCKPDILLLNGLPEIGVYSRYFKHDKIVSIGHSNENWLRESFFKSPARLLKNLITKNFSIFIYKFIAINNCVFENSKYIPSLASNTVVVPTGIPDLGVVNDKPPLPVFGRISRLVPGKGNELLLKAFSNIVKEFPLASLVIAGDGEERGRLEQYAKDLSIADRVCFLGHVDKEKFFSLIGCMVSPSYSEASPLVVMESMSSGVPVISTSVGGVPEIIEDNYSARLIPVGNLDELERAMMQFLNCPEVFKGFSVEARRVFVEKFEISIMVGKLLRALE